ncbi:MAG TPA: hypothetical protein VEA69_08625 [Tepidisphaeraceae bacterium]|nr:hypothetical protein [Tepidisphaeraceae bacterium]
MRPALRIVTTGWTALSLLLLVAAIGLWARSYWHADRYTRNWPNGTETVQSLRGRLVWSRMEAAGVTAAGTAALRGPPAGFATAPADRELLAGFFAEHPSGFGRLDKADRWGTLATRMAPHWALAAAAALLAAVGLWARRRCAPARPGGCPQCGYDLRATPDRCPECGRAASPIA